MALDRYFMKERRKELKLTLQDVADIVGVRNQTISKYENGVLTNMPSDVIEKFSIALKCSPLDILKINISEDELAKGYETDNNKKQKLLIKQFKKLNENGQDKAVEAVTNLTYVPEYKKRV